MQNTINGLFGKLMPFIPDALISQDVISHIEKLNENFPAGLTTIGGMECRLGTDDRNADWFLGINPMDGGREKFYDKISDGSLSQELQKTPGWKAIRGFTEHWVNPQSPVHQNVSFVWLEFDYPALVAGNPIPGVFLLLKDPVNHSGTGGSEYYEWLFNNAFKYLHIEEVNKETEANIKFCFDRLPDKAAINYAALMLGRKLKGIRLVVSIPVEKLEGYLSDVGWEGSGSELRSLVEELSQFVDIIDFNLDIAHKVFPKIGLECILRKKQLQIEPRWRTLVNHLTEKGLCKPEKGRGLLAWSGYENTVLPHETVPSYLFRGISHVKIMYQPGSPLEAKGYMGFRRLLKSDVEKMLGNGK